MMKVSVIVYARCGLYCINHPLRHARVDPLAKESLRSSASAPSTCCAGSACRARAPFMLTGVRHRRGHRADPRGQRRAAGGRHRAGSASSSPAGGSGNRTDLILAATFWAGIIGMVANSLLVLAERRLFHWHQARPERRRDRSQAHVAVVPLAGRGVWELTTRLAPDTDFPPLPRSCVRMHELWFLPGSVTRLFLTDDAIAQHSCPSCAHVHLGWTLAALCSAVVLGVLHRQVPAPRPTTSNRSFQFGRVLPRRRSFCRCSCAPARGSGDAGRRHRLRVVWAGAAQLHRRRQGVDNTYTETATVFGLTRRSSWSTSSSPRRRRRSSRGSASACRSPSS
ncbi:hypothetical protein [Nonomuraea dietziae]|uniref:hypothetical protein n=1 Tax=Nonomuraea dietziae TaxID=65515 RepID=UPI0031D2BC8D